MAAFRKEIGQSFRLPAHGYNKIITRLRLRFAKQKGEFSHTSSTLQKFALKPQGTQIFPPLLWWINSTLLCESFSWFKGSNITNDNRIRPKKESYIKKAFHLAINIRIKNYYNPSAVKHLKTETFCLKTTNPT